MLRLKNSSKSFPKLTKYYRMPINVLPMIVMVTKPWMAVLAASADKAVPISAISSVTSSATSLVAADVANKAQHPVRTCVTKWSCRSKRPCAA